MKTRHHLVRILTLLLFTVLLLTAGCGENLPVTDPDITTGAPGTSGPAETTDDAETTAEATTDDPNAVLETASASSSRPVSSRASQVE